MIIKEKIEQAINILKEKDIDCWITFVRETEISRDPMLDFLIKNNVTWHSAFIITSKGEAIAIIGQGDLANIQDLRVYTKIHAYNEGIKKTFKEVLLEINPSTIALNYSTDTEISDGLTHGMYLLIYQMLREVNLEKNIISSENIISLLRGRKSETELEYIKQAIKHTQDIYHTCTNFIKPGYSEKEIASFIQQKAQNLNLDYSWDEAYCPGVFTGPDTNIAHYIPTDRKVEKGHVLNMDFGVKVNGYCSDLQRTWYVLEVNETDAPQVVKDGFNTIKEAIELARKNMKPGVTGEEIDSVARNYITSKGYDEYNHGLGHQVGMFAHDGFALLGPAWEKYGRKVFVPLEKGMVFTIEPKLYIKDRGVVTMEEMVVITETGAEYLSDRQTELFLIK